jgi:two-component system NtrC family response regulator
LAEEAPTGGDTALWTGECADPPRIVVLGTGRGIASELLLGLAGHFKTEFYPIADLVESIETDTLQHADAAVVEACDLSGADGLLLLRNALTGALARAPWLRPVVLAGKNQRGVARAALASGAWDVVLPAIDPERLRARLLAAARLSRLQRQTPSDAWEASPFEDDASGGCALLGHGPVLEGVRRDIELIAPSDVPVLITGESGTGKELAAMAIHQQSGRAKGPFIPINCSAIPETLLESELFGHERGAFTGATRARRGLFEAADGGTLFLDEIGELASSLQAKLLRFLQDHRVERVGGLRPIPVDVRVLAATNRNLVTSLASGRFREDLYYRLAVFSLVMPRLAERGDDIRLLAQHFLRHYAPDRGRAELGLSPDAVEALHSCPWPGNVRELINRVRRALIVTEGPQVTAADLGFEVDCGAAVPKLRAARRRAEAQCIEDCLRCHGWRKRETAETLGISRTRLYELMRRNGIPDQLPS